MTYAFILGREPALSTAEILARLRAEEVGFDPKLGTYSKEAMIVETDRALDTDFFHALGGSIKMAEVLQETKNIDADLLEILSGLGSGTSMDFGLGVYDAGAGSDRVRSMGRWIKPLSLELKKSLKASGKSVRAVLPDDQALSSVQVDKNRLIDKGAEILILTGAKTTWLARTLAVQAFESFSGRDFGRPGRDAKSGMLPPKLARMMVNLSIGPKKETLLDPFCGSGTVLSEAALLGYRKLIGSDISEKAVQDTVANFTWTIERVGAQVEAPKVFASDVKFLPEKLSAASVGTIVTEPFLGPPMRGGESDQQIHFIYLELMGLYRRSFEAFAKVLKPGAAVVIAFPVFGEKHVNILRDLEAMGFKAESLLPGKAAEALALKSPVGLLYKREDQRVGRDIYRFRFGTK